jgi:hypothetical protein
MDKKGGGGVTGGSWSEILAQHWQSVTPNSARHIDRIDRIELRFRGFDLTKTLLEYMIYLR